MKCICQLAYDTGFTGIARVDARLAHRYEVYGDDCVRRSYDHYNFGIPYSDAPRRHYCFVSNTQTVCGHEACEHARHRPPTYVAKMRHYIESICPATYHYPDVEERGITPTVAVSTGFAYSTTEPHEKWGTAKVTGLAVVIPNEDELAESQRWEEEQFRLHKQLGYRETTPRFTVTPMSTFLEDVATALTEVPMDAGKITEEAFNDAVAQLNADAEDYWNDEMTEEEEEAYWERMMAA